MKKLITILMVITMIMLPATAMAHSTLDEATPAQQSILETSPEHISMTFSTKIESLSNFKLFNSNDEEVAVDNMKVDGAVLSADVIGTLANDEYTVKWSIIGADGHAIKGDYVFEVKAAVVEETDNAATEEEEATEDNVEENAEEQATEEPATETEEEAAEEPTTAPAETNTDSDNATEKKSSNTIYIVGAIIVLVIIGLVIGVRRKK